MDTIPQDTTQKQCVDCKHFFPATSKYFPANAKVKCGLRNQCKACRSAQRKQHRKENIEVYHVYELARIEKHREDNRKYRSIHIEEKRLAAKEYNKTHASERREYIRSHPEQRRVTLQKYAKNHPDENRVRKHKRRAHVKKNGGTHSQSDIRNQYTHQQGKCYYCKKKVGVTYHIDHVIPLSKGGSNGPENLVIACPTCNLHKNDKIVTLF